jgi:hypothetical protein
LERECRNREASEVLKVCGAESVRAT